MPKVRASIEIEPTDEIRVRSRMGGGFDVLIGAPGAHGAVLSCPDVDVAERLAVVLTTSAITHGPLGQAVAATDPARSNVAQFPRRAAITDNPPPSAA